jgi:predicted P-loop ATPase
MNTAIAVGFSATQNAIDKRPRGDISDGWEWFEKPLTDLVNTVHRGWAINPAKFTGTKRADENFVSARMVILDIDNGRTVKGEKIYEPTLSIDQARELEFIQQHCLYAYTSPSHKPDWHKYRLCFWLSEPIEDIALYKRIIRHVGALVPGADRAAMSGTNLFFGNTKAEDLIINPEATPIDVAAVMIELANEDAEAAKTLLGQRQKRSAYLSTSGGTTDPIDKAREYLSHIDPNRADTYGGWIAVGMALKTVSDSLFVDWVEWSSKHAGFVSEADCWSHWKGASFAKSDIDHEMAKLGKWSAEDGRPKAEKRDEVKGKPGKLAKKDNVIPHPSSEKLEQSRDLEQKISDAIAARDLLNEGYLELQEKITKEPMLAESLKPQARLTKEKIAAENAKIKSLERLYSNLRIETNRKQRLAASAKRDAEKDDRTSFRKDYETIHEVLGDRLRYTTLKMGVELDGELIDLEHTRPALSRLTGILDWHTSDDSVLNIVLDLAKQKSFCPIVEYLDQVGQLDVEHSFLDDLAYQIYGIEDPLQNQYLKHGLIGAAKRAYYPGCYFRYLIILYSANQHVGKSSSIKTLFSPAWTGEGQITMDDATSVMILNQSWVHEIPEIDKVFKGRHQSAMKSFVSQTEDLYRRPYGRNIICSPRKTVIWGTTNHNDFLVDETGNTRYLILELPEGVKVNFGFIEENRDRIWSAAVNGLGASVPVDLDEENARLTDERNREYLYEDPWLNRISDWLEDRPWATSDLIYSDALKLEIGKVGRSEGDRLAKIMRKLGWVYKGKKIDGKNKKAWVPVD